MFCSLSCWQTWWGPSWKTCCGSGMAWSISTIFQNVFIIYKIGIVKKFQTVSLSSLWDIFQKPKGGLRVQPCQDRVYQVVKDFSPAVNRISIESSVVKLSLSSIHIQFDTWISIQNGLLIIWVWYEPFQIISYTIWKFF